MDAGNERKRAPAVGIDGSAIKEKEKGTRRMPRISPAKKDATSCEKPSGGAHDRYHVGMSEWGNPVRRKPANPLN